MTQVEPGGSPADELPLGRLEAFSDGVFAIAITLLVLELSVSAGAADDLLQGILDEWPAYLAYVTSFLTIGAIWIGHSTMTGALRAADAVLYRLNLIVLLIASFLPFPTKLMSEFVAEPDAERVAAVFYGVVLLALSLSLTAFARYAFEQRRLVKDRIDNATVEAVVRRGPSYLGYVVAIGVAWFFPFVALFMYLAIALYLTVPGRTIHRLLTLGRT
ncbi:MAG TPA: TMEM175 family protein [Candidatus Limnocylindrales bacterium]|nr:TMEM175 family protein [Candidatus Limnocylindrales bacterium]